MRLPRCDKNSGFTLLEVVVVLVLVSIFTVLAVAQHNATDPTLIVQSQILQSHVRYAQMRAMNSNTVWGIHYNYDTAATDRYYEIFVDSPGNIATLPGESERRVILGEMKITLSSTGDLTDPAPQSFWLSFDSWGQPYFGNGALPATTPLADDPAKLRLAKPGHDDVELVVTQRTGFMP